jgi:hypothetical protein
MAAEVASESPSYYNSQHMLCEMCFILFALLVALPSQVRARARVAERGGGAVEREDSPRCPKHHTL